MKYNYLEFEIFFCKPCPKDRRITYAEISEEGNILFNNIFPKHIEAIQGKMAGLNTDEKEIIAKLLEKLGKTANMCRFFLNDISN
jgi:hypothetical protein